MNRPPKVYSQSVPYDFPVEALLQHLHPAGPRAWAACLALGCHAAPEAYTLLLQLLDSPDWRYRRAALEAIRYHPLALTNLERLAALLDDRSPYVVRTACEVVGKLGIKHGLQRLVNLLSSPDPATRQAAVNALPFLWEPNLTEKVLAVFLSDSSTSVRKAAAWVLMEKASEANWKSLFEIWKEDPLSRHRKWACELAQQFGNETVENDLQVLLKDRDGHVRKAARTALLKDT